MTSDRTLPKVLWIAAGTALAIGLLLTIRTLIDLPDFVARHGKRVQDLRAVMAMEEARRAQEEAIRCWTRIEAAAPPLSDVLGRQCPDVVTNVVNLEAVPSLAGWLVRRSAVTVAGARYDRIAELERAGAASRPPWVLAECVLEASDRPGVAARLELVFETAERVTK